MMTNPNVTEQLVNDGLTPGIEEAPQGRIARLLGITKQGLLEAVSYYIIKGYSPFDIRPLVNSEEEFLQRQEDAALTVDSDPGRVVSNFNENGYVKQASTFSDIAIEEDRTNLVRFNSTRINSRLDEEAFETEITEYEGLQGLFHFLGIVATHEDTGDRAKAAISMIEGLTFIGEKEFMEAVAGIATYWQAYLNEDSQRQIYAVAKLSDDELVKSDAYVLENILAYIGQEQLEQYAGQLVTDPSLLTADPENVKVVILDDWIISGASLRSVIEDLYLPDQYQDSSIEINVIAASQNNIKYGLDGVLVKSYYKAHEARNSGYGVHISGSHSSVDYAFQNELDSIYNGEIRRRPIEITSSPPLINIHRPYRGIELTHTSWLAKLVAERNQERQFA